MVTPAHPDAVSAKHLMAGSALPNEAPRSEQSKEAVAGLVAVANDFREVFVIAAMK
jgi:hypothetical protein